VGGGTSQGDATCGTTVRTMDVGIPARPALCGPGRCATSASGKRPSERQDRWPCRSSSSSTMWGTRHGWPGSGPKRWNTCWSPRPPDSPRGTSGGARSGAGVLAGSRHGLPHRPGGHRPTYLDPSRPRSQDHEQPPAHRHPRGRGVRAPDQDSQPAHRCGGPTALCARRNAAQRPEQGTRGRRRPLRGGAPRSRGHDFDIN